ncbi:hypothetical protein [Stigmatella aurantiaca]|uniref:Conserved uncharacterized protein n=2 Tax=Stigmatella aurantiaca (strain DW4/3-1) TaxID=378806 RepID=E3FW36_STIAD|nr:hypothetical protein [Stigmatella aurantiaca]ADO74757.1 conserved uncharacterized protein [Stigmatella aurantiaca DW4/3-1]
MRRFVALALLALAPACSSNEEPSVRPPPEEGTLDPIPDPHEGGEGGVMPLPDPEEQGGSVGRAPRRLTVAQLKTSIQTTVGRPWDELETLAPSLGRADYANIVTENTEPNLVFAKFMEDGARKVCLDQAAAELNQADPNARVLSRTVPGSIKDMKALSDAQVEQLVVYLSTRFWGAPLAGEELPKWKRLFTQSSTRALTLKKPDQAFAVMCIAMMTDTRFITY